MALDTVILQGSFTSLGAPVTLVLRSDVDWVSVYNYTQAATQQATGRGVEFYWQRGMAIDTGIRYGKTNATDALNLTTLASGGFTLIDSSLQAPGALVAVTSIAGAAGVNGSPRVLVASTAALRTGDVVRLINVVGGLQVSSADFTISVVDATHFDIVNMDAIVNTGAGFYRKINFNPIFYPRTRTITKISLAPQAIITVSVASDYTVGQAVRIYVPAIFGMTEISGLLGKIVAIGAADADGATNTITVDIDSSAFTPFVFPVTADVPFDFAQVVPVGEDTAVALQFGQNILADATLNTAYLGIRLAAGAQSPAGSEEDVIYWRAGKSFSNSTGPIIDGLIL